MGKPGLSGETTGHAAVGIDDGLRTVPANCLLARQPCTWELEGIPTADLVNMS